jgi:hypothetical protein
MTKRYMTKLPMTRSERQVRRQETLDEIVRRSGTDSSGFPPSLSMNTKRVGNPVEGERDSGLKLNAIPL